MRKLTAKNLLQLKVMYMIIISCSTQVISAQIINSIVLDQNNVSCTLFDEGGFFNQVSAGIAGYEVPKGSGLKTIFSGSYWVGAEDPQGNFHISGNRYNVGGNQCSFHSGPIANPSYYGTITYDNKYQNSVWKVSQDDIDFHQQHYQNTGYVTPNSILKWPGNGDVSMGVAPQLAPYADINQNGIYEPTLGEYPDIRGDEAVYIIMNDESYFPDGNQLRIELHAMFYQFNTGNYINNTTFMNVQVFNRSQVNYLHYYQGIYLDFDIGNYADDHVGCSPEKQLLFGYNGDDFDEPDGGAYGYGNNPPCQGIVSLSHPLENAIVFDQGQDGGIYTDTLFWLLMHSQWGDSSQWINPITNLPTNFTFPDNPNDPTGWSEEAFNNIPADRRGMITIYESAFRPGTKICSDYAFIYDRSGSRLQNVQNVWNIAGSLLALYQSSDQFPCQSSSTNALLEQTQEKADLEVFPNPSNGEFTVRWIGGGEMFIELFNAMGQRVYAQQLENSSSIEINHLHQGFYLLKGSNDQGIYTKSVVIE